MKNRNFTIKDVAASIGMDDDKHFCRIFKEETGLTPGEYRKVNIL
ncbi:MAG: AraC family transcriptional regulator [Actinobacteria bacterium]|nr:MAG: AraC family transcriptional regulator [Actinomycetota bacterium]